MKPAPALIIRMLLLLTLCILLQLPVLSAAWPASAVLESAQPQNFYAFTDNGTALKYPVMALTPEQKRAEDELADHAPIAPAAPAADLMMLDAADGAGADFSLLPHLNYVPAERDQNPNCGNCWVWTGTGVVEIALHVQKGIRERLSIQYFNSTYQNGTGLSWACCGGNPTSFADIYRNILHKAIPWANSNAYFRDGPQKCVSGTLVPAATITSTPYYAVSSIGPAELIATHGVGEAQAIANIKYILHQNKAIYFAYGLASAADWQTFQTWWDDSLETAIWTGGYSCGREWTLTGGSHATLCVGYNDEDPNPNNHYWLILNSWGAPSNRPNGLFRIPMHYNYDCSDSTGSPNTNWWTIPVTFADNNQSRQINTPAGVVTISTGAGSLDAAASINPETLPEGLPAGAILPYGVFSFTDNNLAPGANVRFTLSLPYPPAAGLQLWKYVNGFWVDCTSLLSGVDDGDNTIYITIQDGGQGDTDRTRNGSIVDPFALVIPDYEESIRTGSHGSSSASIPSVQQYIPLPNIYVRSAAAVGQGTAGSARVTAELANNGAAAGVGRIALYLDGQETDSRNVSVAAGGTAEVHFEVTGLAPGRHEVKVNDTDAGSLTVDGGMDPVFFIALAAFLVVVCGLFVLYLRRRN